MREGKRGEGGSEGGGQHDAEEGWCVENKDLYTKV